MKFSEAFERDPIGGIIAITPLVLVGLFWFFVLVDAFYEILSCKSHSFWKPTMECCTEYLCAEHND